MSILCSCSEDCLRPPSLFVSVTSALELRPASNSSPSTEDRQVWSELEALYREIDDKASMVSSNDWTFDSS